MTSLIQFPVLVSAALEIEYAIEFYDNTIGEVGDWEPPHIKSTSLGKTQSPVPGFCYAQNRVCQAADRLQTELNLQ